jgi:hypothetical protein
MGELIRPGDALTGFFVQEGRCFRMVASGQIQANRTGRASRSSSSLGNRHAT